jgi:hypothetical protein
MGTIVIILVLLAASTIPLLWMLFFVKRRNTAAGQIIEPLAAQGPRYRDGAVTYNQYDGKRYNIEVEGPDGQSARFKRRHPIKRHKQTKPWMK